MIHVCLWKSLTARSRLVNRSWSRVGVPTTRYVSISITIHDNVSSQAFNSVLILPEIWFHIQTVGLLGIQFSEIPEIYAKFVRFISISCACKSTTSFTPEKLIIDRQRENWNIRSLLVFNKSHQKRRDDAEFICLYYFCTCHWLTVLSNQRHFFISLNRFEHMT